MKISDKQGNKWFTDGTLSEEYFVTP